MLGESLAESGGPARNLDGSTELSAIVDRVRELTDASGAAIALISDQPGVLDCCARSGSTAPEIGASLLTEDSLTALCLRSGEQLRCDNAEADPRVRGTVMYELGVRSLAITPIRKEHSIRGVLAVFAGTTESFSSAHLAQLSATAVEIAEILWKNEEVEELLDGVTKAEAAAKSEQELPAEPSIRTILLARSASSADFATFGGMARPRRKLLPSTVPLIAVAASSMIALAVWAALPSRVMGPQPDKNLESKKVVAAHAPELEVEEAIPGASSQFPASQAVLKIEPSAPTLRQGASLALKVVFRHGRDISAVPMEINYDPKVLRFVDLSIGGFFARDGRAAILSHRDDPATGTLKINAHLPPGASPISGNGTVCQLVFVALQKGSGAISVAARARNSHDKLVSVLGSRVAVTVN